MSTEPKSMETLHPGGLRVTSSEESDEVDLCQDAQPGEYYDTWFHVDKTVLRHIAITHAGAAWRSASEIRERIVWFERRSVELKAQGRYADAADFDSDAEQLRWVLNEEDEEE